MQHHSELHLLSLAWKARTTSNVALVALDTEFSGKLNGINHVVELGLSYVQFHSTNCEETPVIKTRNLIVRNATHLRTMVPFSLDKPEYVEKEADLKVLLDRLFEDLTKDNEWVVLLAHDGVEDLNRLRRACGWRPPRAVVVLDTQRIWYALKHRTEGGSLAVACESYGIAFDRKEQHNAGHDAKHTLELGIHKAKHSINRSTSSSPPPPNSTSAHFSAGSKRPAARRVKHPIPYRGNPAYAPVASTDSPFPERRRHTRLSTQRDATLLGKPGPSESKKKGILLGSAGLNLLKVQSKAHQDPPDSDDSSVDGYNRALGRSLNQAIEPSVATASVVWPQGSKRKRSTSDSYASGEGTSTDSVPRPISYKKRRLEPKAKTHHGSNMPNSGHNAEEPPVATTIYVVDLTADTPPRPGFIQNMDPVDLTGE